MTSAQLTQLFYCFIALGFMLLLGTFLRAIIPAFQKVFLPASVIGGFIGLILGPQVLNLIPLPRAWISIWSLLPGLLIVPVIASTPLGLKFGGGKSSADATKMFGALLLASTSQVLLGLVTLGIFRKFQPQLELYPTFGYELSAGYAGGHGTAGVLGNFLNSLNLPYWETVQGVTTTTATFGLVGGMIIGIVYINIMARRGKTALLKKPSDIPADMAKGIQRDPAKQVSTCKETTFNSSVESLAFHFSIILLACGLAYLLMNFVKTNKVPIITHIPIWAYAIVVMFAVNFVIQKLKLGSLVDNKTKAKIAGSLSDFAITAAIASMPLQTILTYAAPILFMCMLGYIVTMLVLHLSIKRGFSDYHVERTMATWGCSTGVFLNGLVLLKICDSNYELPVINDYSIGFSLTSITGFILMPVVINMMIHSPFTVNLLFQLAVAAGTLVLLFVLAKVSKAAPRKA